jgi:hypothetical protein
MVGNGCGCNGGAVMQATPAAAAPAATDGAAIRATTPTVDPNAFIIRGAKYGNN